jgi:S-methylmethionine-dependent homocysteine/selenocysteine methylase
MAKYRTDLPQLNGKLFMADGGMGTTLIFHAGLDIPHFCTFPLLGDPAGRGVLVDYFRDYVPLVREQKTGFILDSGPTWRASADWGQKLGYSSMDLENFNRQAIEMMCDLRNEFETESSPIVVSGCMGPRGDGYEPGTTMSPDQAQRYHAIQIETFGDTQADMVTAMTLTYSEEAVGIVRAAQAVEIPAVISFTVETDGRLPTGQDLRDAIDYVDDATCGGPAYYMINCAHPSHFAGILEPESDWTNRIRGIRLNASCLSHAELNDATELDDGDVNELGALVGEICETFPRINVVGGCCGTDSRHIREMAINARRART